MGICHSSEKERKRINGKNGNVKLDSKLKRVSSGDFASFISKFGGGGCGASSASAVTEEMTLFQVPGRLFSNGASQFSSLYTQQGRKGTNQDAMVFWENFLDETNEYATFCGVFDGHGPFGHVVARKVRDALPILLRSQWNNKTENGNTNEIEATQEMRHFDDFVDDEGCDGFERDEVEKEVPEKYIPLKNSFLKAFKLMDKELKFHRTIDCFCSGTTAVTLIKQGADLIIGNVGDSRAVLATHDAKNYLVAVQLTVDLKPNLPREAARIHKCKGRVFALQDEPEVARVWLPNSDSPGLAMARAFGDFCLKDFGLISVPDVYHHHISEKDAFVILATDGVWDVLSNKEAIDIVASSPSRGTSARALVDCATRAWRLKYPTSKIDDCAAICFFFDYQSLQQDNNLNETRQNETRSDIASSNLITSHDSTTNETNEIVQVIEEMELNPKKMSNLGQSRRSLAECLINSEEDEWSALEGVTRVNTLLSLPRLLSSDKRSTGRRNPV